MSFTFVKQTCLAAAAFTLLLGSTATAANTAKTPDKNLTTSKQPSSASSEPNIKISFKPQNIRKVQTINFDANGLPTRTRKSLSISLYGKYSSKKSVIGYKFLDVKILTGTGDKLSPNFPDKRRRIPSNNTAWYQANNRNRIYLNLNMQSASNVNSIKKVKGRIKLFVGIGQMQQATLTPIKKYLNKKVALKGLAGDAWIKISRYRTGQNNQNKRIKIIYSKSAFNKLVRAGFKNSSGAFIKPQSLSGRSNNNPIYHVNLPDDGKVVFRFWPKLESVTLPFKVTGLFVTKSNKKQKAQITIETTPVKSKADNDKKNSHADKESEQE